MEHQENTNSQKRKNSSLLVEKKSVLFFLLNLKVSLIHSFTHLCTKCIENCGENCCMLTHFLLLWLCSCATSPIPFSLAFRYCHMTELQGIGHGQKWQSPLPGLENQNPPHMIFFVCLFSTLGPTREASADLKKARAWCFMANVLWRTMWREGLYLNIYVSWNLMPIWLWTKKFHWFIDLLITSIFPYYDIRKCQKTRPLTYVVKTLKNLYPWGTIKGF